jgi:glyoxylase-like metal-dependent hydrolase (beta-lactamase superfamily II)
MTMKNSRETEPIYKESIIPVKLGIVYCYLVKIDDGFILIDTGFRRKRKDLEKALDNAACTPGKLKLIILTHQDFDHTGNASFIREKYDSRIAMHIEDTEAVERGDMLWNRKARNIFTRFILKIILMAYRTGKFEKFSPDIQLADGDNLSSYGFNATVLHLPGHSKGSIGILTTDSVLFCGDLFMNFKRPDKSSLIDREQDLDASIEKLKKFEISTVFPGHGSPFALSDFFASKNNEKG